MPQFKTYDEQIAHLTEHPEDIYFHWMNPSISGPLFKYVGITEDDRLHDRCGCLTMIREYPNRFKAIIGGTVDVKLTEEIANDVRIPERPHYITPDQLPVFKEWQERIDALASK